MTALYCAKWVLPISATPICDGGLVVSGGRITAVGVAEDLRRTFTDVQIKDLGEVALLPGFINAHSHLELTAMRGFLDDVEHNFFSWLRKLTMARLAMSSEDLYFSAVWGACEAARAGITCFGDSSDGAATTMSALRDVGLRGIVFQESFGPDPRLVGENIQLLKNKIANLRKIETSQVRAGVSPHAPYTVCAPQLEMIAEYALAEKLPLMMHAAESKAEEMFLRTGTGGFADSLEKRGIPWKAPGVSVIAYLQQHRILETEPVLAHCINVDGGDVHALKETRSKVAHCPRSNAKLGHGRAPLNAFLENAVPVGIGTDSMASNNECDVLSEARYAILAARSVQASDESSDLSAETGLRLATIGGASALSMNDRVGELREGLEADFIAIALNRTHQLPSSDPVGTLVFTSSGHDVTLTVVAGQEVYVNGRITTVDEKKMAARIIAIAKKLPDA